MPTLFPSPLLRRVLLIDAATCLGTGLLMTVAASPFARLVGLPASIHWPATLILLGFGGFVGYLGARSAVASAAVGFAIIANLGWVIGSIGLVVVRGSELTGLGWTFVIAQAAVVALLAELEYIGLRRSRPIGVGDGATMADLRAR